MTCTDLGLPQPPVLGVFELPHLVEVPLPLLGGLLLQLSDPPPRTVQILKRAVALCLEPVGRVLGDGRTPLGFVQLLPVVDGLSPKLLHIFAQRGDGALGVPKVLLQPLVPAFSHQRCRSALLPNSGEPSIDWAVQVNS